MINLEEVKPFAEGGNRVCYVHPSNKHLCLKISDVFADRYIKEKD